MAICLAGLKGFFLVLGISDSSAPGLVSEALMRLFTLERFYIVKRKPDFVQ